MTVRLPKWSQNRCPNSSKTNAKTCEEKHHGNLKNHVSLKGKIIQIHLKTYVFGGSPVARANGKGIRKSSKNIRTSIPKLMLNRYTFHARKSDARNKESYRKWEPKRVPKTENTHTHQMHNWKMTNNLKTKITATYKSAHPTKKPY